MKKRIFAFIIATTFITNSAYASILGSDILNWSHKIANGTDLYKNEFMSTQEGVGRQTEYYAKYSPNESVVPKVITGQSIWGLRNIKKAEEFMKNNNMTPLLGINASYFSFSTGVPMGVVISDGKIISKDLETYETIGFNDDGTAFIAPLKIYTGLKFKRKVMVPIENGTEDLEDIGEEQEEITYEEVIEDTELEISHINKYNQDATPIINLYTEDFDDDNHNEVKSLSVVLSDIKGELAIGKTVTATVEDKFIYKGAIEIPKGKFVLTLNENSDQDLFSKFNGLEVGTTVEISSFAWSGDERWANVDSAMGSVGEKLIENGEVKSGFQKGAAPRTAVGITENGELIFYVLDGRQTGYSYGSQIATLAKRMKELGCKDAINLDGGGSTAISGIYPGSDSNEVINTPSEGKLRACSNYLFLVNNKKPTGILGGLYMYPFEQHYLSGYSEELYLTATDTNYYKMDNPENVTFDLGNAISVFDSDTRILHLNGTETVEIKTISGDVVGKDYYHTYETPTEIVVKSGGKTVEKLNVKRGDKIALTFDAYYNNIKLKANAESFNLSVPSEIGKVENNIITIESDGGEGVLKVSVGEYTKEMPITVETEYPFVDILKHWAKDKIKYVFKKGIVSGYESENGGLSFMPNSQITREEFAVIMCKYLGYDIEELGDFELNFDDVDRISDWSKPYVYLLSKDGFMLGKENGKEINFAPKDKLTRAEAITIISRILKLDNTKECEFIDSNDIPSWAKEHIDKMVYCGIVSGYEDNTIKPLNLVTRAEAVTLLYNVLNIK